jgi:DNA repair protein RecO (recombination protein O)
VDALADRALVLRRFPYGESSLVVHAITPLHGRVHLLAKGAYRATSRYAWTLDLFDTLAIEWSPARGMGLELLRAAAVVERRARIPRALDRYRCALEHLELAELAARPGQAEKALFELLERALSRLDEGRSDPAVERVAFDLAFLDVLGLAPAFERCASCAAVLGDGAGGALAFSVAAGGSLCERCAARLAADGRRVARLPRALAHVAEELRRAGGESLARTRLSRRLAAELRVLGERLLDYHLEARPRSRGASA